MVTFFSVFMFRNFDYCKVSGYSAFMTPFVWMFIKTYEQLREYIIGQKSITTLIQMEYSAFEEATVPICSFVLKNGKQDDLGLYIKLSDFKGGMETQKNKVLEAIQSDTCSYFFETNDEKFSKIPGAPIAYWITEKLVQAYSNPSLSDFVDCKSGIMTGSDEFIKLWFEPKFGNINFDCKTYTDMGNFKWFPLNSGGDFRKWYGNNSKIVNLYNGGSEIRAKVKNYRLRDTSLYFKKGITWGRITSSKNSIQGNRRRKFIW